MAVVVGLILVGTWGRGSFCRAQAATKPATSPAATATATQASPAEIVAGEIVKVVGQNDPVVRRNAAVTICKTRSKEGVAALISVLTSRNNEAAKVAVCEAITQTRWQAPELIEPLKALLEADAIAVQEAAAAALGTYSDEAVAAALNAYRQRRERTLLAQAVAGLMDRLYQSTSEPSKRDALVLDWLKSPLAMQRLKALNLVHDALRSTGAQPSPEVLARIRALASDPDEPVRAKLVAFLRDLGMLDDAPRLAAMVARETSPAVRQEIYKALGKLANPKTIPVCITGLDDPEPQVAGAAAEALGRLCKAGNGQADSDVVNRAVAALMERYASARRPDSTLQRSLVEALANIAGPKAAPILVKHAGPDEPDPAVRQIAIVGLGRLGEPAHLDIVLDRLTGDPDAAVRAAAAKVVGILGYELVHLDALRSRMDRSIEPNPAVASQAWEAYLSLFQRLGATDQEKALRSWEVTAPDRMILLAAKIKPEIRGRVAAFLLQYVTTLNRSDHDAAVAFVELLSHTIPDRFGPEWAKRFEHACRPPQTAPQSASTKPGR